jgi:dTDP-glucose 4,6-dehydratase
MMTILVTGGAGFIGSNFIIDWMTCESEAVVCLDKLTYAGNRRNLDALHGRGDFSFVHCGIEDAGKVAGCLAANDIRAVVNLAAETHVDRSIRDPEAFVQTNVVGTFRLLETVKVYWQGLTPERQARFRFLHVSTDEVYGTLSPMGPPLTEQSPFKPNSPYAASKAASDHLVRAYDKTYGLPTLITNCSNNYGPFHFPEKLIPLMIHNALAGRSLPIYGDGQHVRDWLYVADHCSAIRRVLAAGRPGETYHVGGNAGKTNIEVVRTICALLDQSRPRADGLFYAEQIAFVKDRPGHDRRYALDVGKINRELGWAPTETFETRIAQTVRWYLNNPAWVESVTRGAYREWVATQYE